MENVSDLFRMVDQFGEQKSVLCGLMQDSGIPVSLLGRLMDALDGIEAAEVAVLDALWMSNRT